MASTTFEDNYEYIISTDYKGDTSRTLLQWTTEPPAVAGLYRVFYKHDIDKHTFCTWMEVASRNNIMYTDKECTETVRENIETAEKERYVIYWLGPIPEPEPPCQIAKPDL